jgi:hypothetical protein
MWLFSSTTYLNHVFFITLAYFVLWDDDILGNMLNPNTPLGRKALKDLLTLEPPESNSSIDKSSKLNSHYRSNWLETAQHDMVDVDKLRMAGQLVGKMYNLCKKSSKGENGHWDIYNEDSIAFAKAYKDAMVSNVQRTYFLSQCLYLILFVYTT